MYNQPRRRKSSSVKIVFLLVIIFYLIVILFVPMPKFAPKASEIAPTKPNVSKIYWPGYGQAAIGAKDYGLLATSGEQKSAPIASIAKTMMALAVLQKKPIQTGQTGPTLTMTADDVKFFEDNLAQNGSVVPVQAGEKLTEYQMIQALMLPSGDNIADTLANWSFGSMDNYLQYANAEAAKLNMTQTHFADASGLSPETVSSAQDLIILGQNVMAEPILADIVSQQQVTLPVAGTVRNYNTLLGGSDVVGIKTGNTDEAGGCFLFAAKTNLSGQNITLIGAILGAKDRLTALTDTRQFLNVNSEAFELTTMIHKNQTVGVYKTPWGQTINAIAKNDLQVVLTKEQKANIKIELQDIKKPLAKGAEVGQIAVSAGFKTFTTTAILSAKISRPPLWWRLIHPFN